MGFPGVLGWPAGRPNGAPCGRRVGLPVAGRIARREGPRCQGLSEKLGTVLKVGFVYYNAYKLFGTLWSDLGCVVVLGCLGCCVRLLACSMGVSECAVSGY